MRVRYTEILERFAHIDATFVSCDVSLPSGKAHFAVRFYPWWEHPAYLQARSTGSNWGFADFTAGQREVIVLPVGLREARLRRRVDVTDWAFYTAHPHLWRFEARGTIFINEPIVMADTIEEVLQALPPQVTRRDLYGCLDPLNPYCSSNSLALGDLPLPVFRAIRQVLSRNRVRHKVFHEPEPTQVPVLFMIDGEDYMVADDFFLEVPDFKHRPEWFAPTRQ